MPSTVSSRRSGTRARATAIAALLAFLGLSTALLAPVGAAAEPGALPEAPSLAAGSGTIVWSKGGDIWAMSGDGTGARVLVPKAAASGMTSLGSPSVHPAGRIVAFAGRTDAHQKTDLGWCGFTPNQYICNTVHYGYNSTGIYRWDNGATTRLSGAPAWCNDCTSLSSEPEPRADGSVVYTFTHCGGFVRNGTYDCESAIGDTASGSYPSCPDVGGPVPNPANGTIVAHTGCWSGDYAALVVTGPGRTGERVVACDDVPISDASWSPAGDQIVTVEEGGDAGLWVYGSANAGCGSGALRHAVVAPEDVYFSSPRLTGDGRLLFASGGELWSVPAGCDSCAFPAQATQLTTGGDNASPAWTSDPLVVTSAPPETPGVPGSGDTASPSLSVAGTATKQRVLKQKSSILVQVRSNEAAAVLVKGKVTVPGKDPAVSRKASLEAGKKTKVKVRLSKKALRAVKRSWAARKSAVAKLTVRVADAAGNTATRTLKVKLVR